MYIKPKNNHEKSLLFIFLKKDCNKIRIEKKIVATIERKKFVVVEIKRFKKIRNEKKKKFFFFLFF